MHLYIYIYIFDDKSFLVILFIYSRFTDNDAAIVRRVCAGVFDLLRLLIRHTYSERFIIL